MRYPIIDAPSITVGTGALVIALIGGIVGAIMGGGASVVGSISVHNWELRQNMRRRLYEEFLPQLTDMIFGTSAIYNLTAEHLRSTLQPPDIYEKLDELDRIGVLIYSRRARRFINDVYETLQARTRLLESGPKPTKNAEPARSSASDELIEVNKRLAENIKDLDFYLLKKLR